ncbi:uncharacterized protein PRCAT00001555001 [Priceomyces carsonii]|uniref:uncharacterized protein n=1 Tax=Priceomyces carsonii TaxID=28549 RepID=UPI002ED92F67|nr:unnamed protein product [Priceomyces carsonii]
MVLTTHPDLELIKIYVEIEGLDPIEVPLGKGDIEVKIPEHTKYTQTFHFKVKNKPLKKFWFKVTAKKHGITVNERTTEVGDEFEPREEEYVERLPEQETPGGFLIRGRFPTVSTYYSGDEVLIESPWTLEITKK